MKFFLRLIIFSIGLFSAVTSNAEQVLRIGIADPTPPFVIISNNTYSGIAIDLWQTIAANEKLKYQYVLLDSNTDDAIKALHDKKIDVLLGPISITSERFKQVDFSYPFFLNDVGVIEIKPATDLGHIFSVFLDILSSPFLIWFLIIFVVYVHALWLFERRFVPHFPKSYARGISYVLWPHLLQRGLREIPRTLWGRIISVVWAIAAAILATAILATVTSKLTLALVTEQGQFHEISDLRDMTVAAVKGTHAVVEAEKVGAKVTQVSDLGQAMDLLIAGKVDAVVEDYILAKVYINDHEYSKLHLSPLILSSDEYGIAVSKDNPLLKRINNQLLFLQDEDATVGMCAKYIGQDSRACRL